MCIKTQQEESIPKEIREELEDAGVLSPEAAGEDDEQNSSASIGDFYSSILELGKKLDSMPPSVKKEFKAICKSLKEQAIKIKNSKEDNEKVRRKTGPTAAAAAAASVVTRGEQTNQLGLCRGNVPLQVFFFYYYYYYFFCRNGRRPG